jgi:hypothetical protein
MRIRCTGGGFSSQVYAIRQAIAKSMVAYTQKCQCRPSPATRGRGARRGARGEARGSAGWGARGQAGGQVARLSRAAARRDATRVLVAAAARGVLRRGARGVRPSAGGVGSGAGAAGGRARNGPLVMVRKHTSLRSGVCPTA